MEEPKIIVDKVKVRKDDKTGWYFVYFETGDKVHPFVLSREMAESLIKNLNRL